MDGLEDGILLVDKAQGQSSHDVVQQVRKATGIRKVGHGGTLDPFATGLLIILIGQGTKISEFITSLPKTYEALIRLGVETDTYDRTGRIVKETQDIGVSPDEIRYALDGFVGEIDQIPPPFSALKINGQRAYSLARQGKQVRLPPRRVKIYDIRIENVDLPYIGLKLRCSSGTYIRSLAFDLGKKLGCGAHLNELRRTEIGPFQVSEAVQAQMMDQLKKAELMGKMLSMVEALVNMATVEITQALAEKVHKGYCPKSSEIDFDGTLAEIPEGHIKLVCEGRLVAILKTEESARGVDASKLQLRRVFS